MLVEPTVEPSLPPTPAALRLDSAAGRWVLAATVLGSSVAMLTATVVNVALPAIGEGLDAQTAGLQWVLNGYLLALASLVLIGGSLGDRLGHRRVFVWGTLAFTVASVACAVAPDIRWLVGARVVQGAAAALLMPESLAILETNFHPDDRGRAIGSWSALGGIAAAVGPLVGGWLIDVSGWRAVFLMVVPLSVVVVVVALWRIPPAHPTRTEPLDLGGAAAVFLGLGLSTHGLIQGSWAPLAAGATALAVFVWIESRHPHPMMPLSLFTARDFSLGNAITFFVYGALGGTLLLLVIHLQVGLGYSAIQAGAALLPITALMLLLSASAGGYAQARGARGPLVAGSALMGGGLLLLTRVGPGVPYWTSTFPALCVFGLGLAATVAPVTTLVLGAAPDDRKGAASGINNAVSRVGQLIAVALLPTLVGGGLENATALSAGFGRAVAILAGVCLVGVPLSWALMAHTKERATADGAAGACRHCAIDGAPLRVREEAHGSVS